MTSLKLSEVIVDAAIAKLRAGIDARVAAVNQDKNDNVTIESPHDIFPFGAPGLIGRAPVYVVTTYGESPVYEKEGPHAFVYSEQIGVMIVEEDPDREAVGRKLLRQQRALIECLWDDPPREALTGSAFTLEPVKHIPGPTFEPTQDVSMWRSYFIQIFVAHQMEGD